MRDFPGYPVVKTLYFHYGGMSLIPDWGTINKILWPKRDGVGGEHLQILVLLCMGSTLPAHTNIFLVNTVPRGHS